MTEQLSNQPRILVEFTAEEVSWLADRLHEMRSQWTNAQIQGAAFRDEASPENQEKIEKAALEIDQHKKFEAAIRNRILDKGYDQGFGIL